MSNADQPTKKRTPAQRFAALWESANGPPDVFAFLAEHREMLPDVQLEIVARDQ